MIRSPLSGEPINVKRAAPAPDKRLDDMMARNDALVQRLLAIEGGAKDVNAMVVEAMRASTKALELCGTMTAARAGEKPDAIMAALTPRLEAIEQSMRQATDGMSAKIEGIERGMATKFAAIDASIASTRSALEKPAPALAPPTLPAPVIAAKPAPAPRGPMTVNIVERDANNYARTFAVPSHNLIVRVAARDANNRASSFVVNQQE